MNPEAWIALAALAVTIAGGLIFHMMRDESRHSKTETEIRNIKEQIGTHDSGMRGQLHEHANLIGALKSIVYFIARKLKIEVMKEVDKDE